MMKRAPSARVERIGVNEVGVLVERDLEWIYREQAIEDYGIDAHIEVVESDQSVTGQLVAVQVRSRSRPFDRVSDGWEIRESLDHLEYWLGHVLPVIIVIFDTVQGRGYWQRVSPHTVVRTAAGFKVKVPDSQPLDERARPALAEIAKRDDDRAIHRFDALCQFLPERTAAILREAHADDPVPAARLTQLLAEGRAEPSLTAQSVLAAPPRGVTEESWNLWRAVGSYAVEHDIIASAASAFERAALHADDTARPRLFGLAACLMAQLTVQGPDDKAASEAQRLIVETRAREASSPLADLAEAVIRDGAAPTEGEWAPRPWALPSSILDLSDEELRKDPMLAVAVGDEALLHGEVERAIDLFRFAVTASEGSPSTKLKLAHALVRRASNGSALATVDYRDAERFAREALEEQRQWAGPSENALELLLHILLVRSALTDALNEAQMSPAGSALPREAMSEGVRFLGARAALALGRRDLATELIAGIVSPLRLAQLRAWSSEAEGDADGARTGWIEVTERATETHDLTALLVASQKLASAGVWPIRGFQDAEDEGVVPKNLAAILHAVADDAQGHTERALTKLRQLAKLDVLAVEHQAQILIREARIDDAVQACESGAERFQAYQLLMLAADALLQAERPDESAQILTRLLSGDMGSQDSRRSNRLNLIEYLFTKQEWSNVEAQALAELGSTSRETVPPLGQPVDKLDSFSWALIVARVNRRDLVGARAAWTRFKPAIVTPQQARAWLLLQRTGAWQQTDLEIALSIAEHWPGEEQIASHVVATLVLETTSHEGASPLPQQLLERLAAVRDRYLRDYPDGALSAEEFDRDTFVARMESQLRPIAQVSGQLEKEVRHLRLPVGMFSTAFHRPYALAVLSRPAGVTPAGTPFENDYEHELEAASDALDAGVAICETSALYLGHIVDDVWPVIAGSFKSLKLPIATYDDILRTSDELVVPSSGVMQYDTNAGRLVLSNPDAETTSLLRERASAIEAIADSLDRVPVGDLTVMPDYDPEGDAAWLSALQYASDEGVAVYSDDVALRQLARAVGVPAFGTLAVVHALMEREAVDDITEDILRRLMLEYVVDLPIPTEMLIEVASAAEWKSGPGMTCVSRPRWWAEAETAAANFLLICRRVKSESPELLGQWVYAGVTGYSVNASPESQPDLIAAIVALVLARVTGLEDPMFRAVVSAARDAALSLDCEDPLDRIKLTVTSLVAEISDRDPQAEDVRLYVERAFSELDLPS